VRFEKMSVDERTPVARVTHLGGCHCGDVRFEVDASPVVQIVDCNCSMCATCGFEHLIVPKSAFRLLTDRAALSDYRFGTGVAQHLFCRRCGVKSFYIPRSNPDGVSVNLRCVDPGTITSREVMPFDGQDWERHGESLRHLSE
jgi:hypothetical protein